MILPFTFVIGKNNNTKKLTKSSSYFNMEKLIEKLKRHNIDIDIKNDYLKLDLPRDFDCEEILEEVRQNRQELISFIKKARDEVDFKIIEPSETKEYYALTSSQKRLYFLYEFDRISLMYNMPQTVRLFGSLNIAGLQATFKKLIARHESLRTSFTIVDDEPVQRMLPDVEFEIEYFESVDSEVRSIVDEFIRPFDLSQAPLLRVGVVVISLGGEGSPSEYILMMDMHHIITDRVSMGIMMKEFMSLYNGEELAELKLQYKDYSEWQQGAQQQSLLVKQKEFWLREFSEYPEMLALPTDYIRPSIRSEEGDSVGFSLSVEDTASLKALCSSKGATMYMLLLSIYNILLSKLSNQEDIVIGTPAVGRHHVDLENIIGMFVNTLCLYNHPIGDLSFSKFLTAVQIKTLSCIDNQGYQYEELIDVLQVKRDTSRNPLFDVVFSYQHVEGSEVEIPGLKLKPYNSGHQISKFDLTLMANDSREGIYLNFIYSTSLFKRESIERFGIYFQQIVRAIVIDPELKLSSIEIITESEKRQLLNEFNNTYADYPRGETIISLFEKQVERTPNKPAIVFEDKILTYHELNRCSNQLARKILANGVTSGSIIGIILSRSSEVIISILGILKTGSAYIPIDPEYPAERIQYIIEDSELGMLLIQSDSKYKDIVKARNVELIDIVSDVLFSGSAENLEVNFSSSDLAYMIYTSGSTGKPKGVMIEHRNVLNFVRGITDRIDMHIDDTMLCLTTISFDIFVLETILPLLNEQKVVMASTSAQNDPNAILGLIESHHVNLLQITPSHLQLLLLGNNIEESLNSIKILMVGGETFPEELLNVLRKIYKGKIYNMYGPTETTVWSTVQELTLAQRIDIGRPIANTTIRILGKYNNLQPVNISGELLIGGQGVGRGYWKRQTLTKERFINDLITGKGRLYRTGDLARWLPDGSIEFLGRLDEQVKIRGFRIELGEIEHHLLTHEKINEVIVLAKEKEGEKYLAAYYVSTEELTASELRAYLLEKLPDYMIPAFYIHLVQMPLNPNGKIDRRALPEPQVNRRDDCVLPSDGLQEKLVQIWSEVLKLEKEYISVSESFFDLGGHSLIAPVLISRISKELNVSFDLKTLFRYQTILALSKYISENLAIQQVD